MKMLRALRLIGILLGLCLAVAGLMGVKTGLQSASWATAPARIVVSEATGKGEHRASLVMAEYRVGADVYQCGHVRLGRDNLASDARRYPVGTSASVAYDPDQVTHCALEAGVSALSIALLVAGVACLGLAALAHRRLARLGALRVGPV